MTIRQRIAEEDGRLYNVWDQPDRGLVLDANKSIRNDRRARKLKHDWAAPHLRIPELDLQLLKQANPDLSSPDGQIRRRAWLAFYGSPESAPYRVRVKAGGATNRVYLGGKQ